MKNLKLTLEFCCSNKDSGRESKRASEKDTAYVWSGMIRRSLIASGESPKKHRARIVFLKEGHFMVSACAKVSSTVVQKNEDGESLLKEETWWAPLAENIVVDKA